MTRFLRVRTADNTAWQIKGQWTSAPNTADIDIDDAKTGTTAYRHNFIGTWSVGTNTSTLGGSDHYTNTTGAKDEFIFTGPRIAAYGSGSTNQGEIDVYIDGVLKATWDTYRSSRVDGMKLGEITGLIDTQHTIALVCKGTKNASSTGTYISIDWFRGPFRDVPADDPPPPAPTGTTISHLLLPGKRPSGPDANDGNPFVTPLGANGTNVHAGLQFAGAASNDRLTTDSIKIGMSTGDPLRDMLTATTVDDTKVTVNPNYKFPAGTKVHVPSGLTSSGGWNSCGALLSDDGVRVWQGQTLYLSAGGNPSWAYTIPHPNDGGPVDLRGTSPLGSHGGSRLSAAMGTIRAWEWADDTIDIQHALLINLWAKKYLRGKPQGEATGHRWPAVVADDYWDDDGKDGRPLSSGHYGQLTTPPAGMKMGALLRLLPTFDLGTVTHTKAKRVAKALKSFGGYVGDDTYWDVHAISVESTINSDWNNQNATFHSELQTVFQNLYLVTNNSATNIGGGGAFLAPIPPALA